MRRRSEETNNNGAVNAYRTEKPMNVSQGKMLTAIAAGVAAAMISAGAWSQPVTVNPGDNNVTIPTYTGPVPTFTVLGSTGIQADTVLIGTTPVLISFDEYAVTTSLNPNGVTFAFAIATTNNPASLSASLPGFTLSAGTLTTSVEGCNPFVASATVCGTATGFASRSTGAGSTLSFSTLGTTLTSVPGVGSAYVTNPVAIFTNASSWVDPTVTVTDDGVTATFSGLAPAGTASGGGTGGGGGSTGVPEPATFGLLGLGMLGAFLRRRRLQA
jgi:hypothetical protein